MSSKKSAKKGATDSPAKAPAPSSSSSKSSKKSGKSSSKQPATPAKDAAPAAGQPDLTPPVSDGAPVPKITQSSSQSSMSGSSTPSSSSAAGAASASSASSHAASSSSSHAASSSAVAGDSPNTVLKHTGAISHRPNLSDVALLVAGGKTLHAHQCVLNIRAPKLAGFIEHGKKMAKKTHFKVQSIDLLKQAKISVSAETMAVVLQYIYGDNLDLAALSPMLVLQTAVAARPLELHRLVRLCHDHLRATINMQNVFSLIAYSFDPQTKEDTVFNFCLNFAHQHIKEFVQHKEQVAGLGMPLFQEIVTASLEEYKPLPAESGPPPPSTLLQDFHRLFDETVQGGPGQPDGFVVIGGSKIQFHKALLAAHTDGFAILQPQPKEDDCSALLVQGSEISADAFTAMLRYIYYGEASLSPVVGCNLAPYCNKFGLKALQNICEGNIASNIDANNVLQVLRVAYLPENQDRADMKSLRENGIIYLRANLKNVDVSPLVSMDPRIAVDVLLAWKANLFA